MSTSRRFPAPVEALAAALSMFTTLPSPTFPAITRRTAHRAVVALPWVGLLLGFAAAAVSGAVLAVGATPLVAAVTLLGLLAWWTGGLHLDGVADVADGLGSRAPSQRALQIMKRSDIGPMGVISLVFVLLLGIAVLTGLAPAGPFNWFHWMAPVALGPAWGRFTVLLASTRRSPSARPGGFGSLVTGAGTTGTIVASGSVLAVITAGTGWLFGAVGALVLTASAALAVGWALLWLRHLVRRFGGVTGDCFGSLIETTQLAYWLGLCLGIPLVS